MAFPKLKSLYLNGLPAGLLSNCLFPNLISLRDDSEFKTITGRRWPLLQNLNIHVENETLADLRVFAESDCCPNLTTLTIEDFYKPGETDFSFLARCPHMPFLSLIRLPYYFQDLSYIVDTDELIPVRGDVMMDDLTARMVYRIPVVF